jgi:signal transduction histidine kinase
VENQYHSPIEAKNFSSKFFVSEDLRIFFQNEILPTIDVKIQQLNLSSSFNDKFSEIYVHHSNNSIQVFAGKEKLLIPFWRNNINQIAKIIFDWLNYLNVVNNDNFRKLIKSTTSNDKTLAKNFSQYKDWSLKKAEIAKLYKQNLSLQTLPINILSLSSFNNYLSTHILIHHKGESWANSLSYNKNSTLKEERIAATDFNKLFSMIKKSKNKSFSRDHIEIFGLPLLGSFLAKDILLSRHNTILIISRNDFLSPSKEEIQFFEDFTQLLPNYVEHLIEMQQSHIENIRSINVINSLPLSFEVLKNHKSILKSENIKDVSENYPINTLISSQPYELKIYDIEDNDILKADLFHLQRISLLGELLNTLRHEISNPLFGLKLAIDLLDPTQFEECDKIYIEEISKSVDRCQKIIESFSALYQNTNTTQVIQLKKLVQEVLTLTKSETRGISTTVSYHNFNSNDQISLVANPTWLAQILFNLIVNSAQSLKNDIDNKLKVLQVDIFNDSDKIKINLSDNGPGIQKEIMNEIFKPFFTTKKSGTGLGLSISMNLAKKMGGELSCSNQTPRGVCFSLVIKRNNYENTNH